MRAMNNATSLTSVTAAVSEKKQVDGFKFIFALIWHPKHLCIVFPSKERNLVDSVVVKLLKLIKKKSERVFFFFLFFLNGQSANAVYLGLFLRY